jgi:hypothetical protein
MFIDLIYWSLKCLNFYLVSPWNGVCDICTCIYVTCKDNIVVRYDYVTHQNYSLQSCLIVIIASVTKTIPSSRMFHIADEIIRTLGTSSKTC